MEIVVRATVVFALVLVLTRGLRRRALSEMAPFEMILLIVIGDIVQQAVTQEDYSLTGAVLAVGTFGFWAAVLTWLTWRSARLRRVVEGVPVLLVREGVPVDAALRIEQMPLDEVLEAARQQGIDDLAEVRSAVLEPSGRVSVIRR